MSLHDLTREQNAVDAQTELGPHYQDWHCLRCLSEFETSTGFGTGALDDRPRCPGCGWDNAVEPGGLATDRSELPVCCGCEKPYSMEAVRLGDWDCSDMESPVCRECINEWTKKGAGYYQCTGCGVRVLTSQIINSPVHLRRVKRHELVNYEPCGQWEREEESLLPEGSPSLKSGGGSSLPALGAIPAPMDDFEVAAVMAVVCVWAVVVWLLTRSKRKGRRK